MDILIRIAELGDSKEIARLTNELGYAALENQTNEWLIDLLESNNHGVFVAYSTNCGLLGWVVVEKRPSLESGFKAEISVP